MTTAGCEFCLFARRAHRFLFARDCRRRFECHSKVNLSTVRDPALDAAGIICRCPNLAAAHFKWIVVLRAAHARGGKTRPDLETFRRRQTEHRLRQIGFELVENRLAESDRRVADYAFDYTA